MTYSLLRQFFGHYENPNLMFQKMALKIGILTLIFHVYYNTHLHECHQFLLSC